MIRRPPRSTLSSSSAASDVYKRQVLALLVCIAASLADSELFNVDTVVPESDLISEGLRSIPLIPRARSEEDHKRLTDWIALTHRRTEHPVTFLDEDGNGKLVSEVQLKNSDLVEYFGQVSIGKQKFSVVFDTGSGIFWVPGKECTDAACQTHTQLKPTKDIHLEQGDVSIKYGTGSMTGRRAVSDVSISGVNVKNQDFLMSTQENGGVFSMGKFDGVFGMGRKALASILQKPGDPPNRADPFYINAINQHLLKAPLFSFYVSKGITKPGAVILGGTNSKLYKGPIHWHQGKSDAYWLTDVHRVGIKNGEEELVSVETHSGVEEFGPTGVRAIADSGTSLMVGPHSVINPLLPHVTALSDCSNMNQLKTVFLEMKDTKGKTVTYHLTPEQYVMKRFGTCSTGIGISHLVLASSHPTMILGDTFLRSHYSVYNHPKNQVGFAQANHDHEATGIPKVF
eukprot:TRINITY_DN2083_c0_g1_i2.p1 TRINITY_DN2083_c0_g1~~TRINITY_DN2083_c0_g1_i2.p1  ORF type:complete len:456 (-),score=100.79 TRINITY_DN2083_c0_g1_i2:320-1687(-)